mmetsp:Transcript_44799/g.122358  ORF Transcript_44799/g.122358 Transcript_44799/m.122358 type:complete len:258 (+) Transcript_44799:399-1172(+)
MTPTTWTRSHLLPTPANSAAPLPCPLTRLPLPLSFSPVSKHGGQAHFGVFLNMVLAKAVPAVDGAQWTGVTTTLASQFLAAGRVDAVVVAGATDADPLKPMPRICRTAEEVQGGRGVKPSLCPSLSILDQIAEDPSIKRLLYCGVGCSVQALRAVEASLGLDELYVLGTHCVDNSPSVDATRLFLDAAGISVAEDEYAGYEFMADFRVHAKSPSGSYEKVPYFCLPGSVAEKGCAIRKRRRDDGPAQYDHRPERPRC